MKTENLLLGIEVVLFLSFFFTIVYSMLNAESFECRNNRKTKKELIYGVVENLEKDTWNHNNELITFTNGYKYEWHDENYFDFLSNTIEVGDSLHKSINSLILHIYKKDTLITFNMGYECTE